MLTVLVDFDNLVADKKKIDLSDVAAHILARLGTKLDVAAISAFVRLHVRFYGGWYEDALPTHRAQTVAVEIQRDFPAKMQCLCPDGTVALTVTAELATSPLSAPDVHLLNTYRRRQTLAGLRVTEPSTVGCDPVNCGIRGIRDFIKKGRCSDCGTASEKILWRSEQKLVDVMLATDLLTIAASPDTDVCIVSSDDDFWPAILCASRSMQRTVLHLHAKPNRRLANCYTQHAPPNYKEIIYEEEL